MKNKMLVVVSVFALVFGLFGGRLSHLAFARDGGGEGIESATSGNDSRVTGNQGTSSSSRVEGGEDQQDNNNDEDINDNNGDNGNEHRTQMGRITDQLQKIADKHSKAEDDLKGVIEEMASSSKDAAEAIDNLDNEGSVKKFFLGPDFNSLGELRSTVATTQNHIDRLTKALEKVTDPAAKATLETQITALKDVASSTQEFVNSHESVFSLFGWFVRLFSKD